MSVNAMGKLAAIVLLGSGLTACIDAKVEVELLGDTTARATMTQIMGPDIYAMVKMSAEEADADAAAADDDFCAEGELTETADGGATCVITEEGAFADLGLGSEDGSSVVFAAAGPGLVRVSMSMGDMKTEIGAEDEMDADTKQMMEAFFTGHAVTVRFAGLEVTETNMELSADRTTAEKIIPFLDLINHADNLPDELYAVVRVP